MPKDYIQERMVLEAVRFVVTVECHYQMPALGIRAVSLEQYAEGIGLLEVTEESRAEDGSVIGTHGMRLHEIRRRK